VEVNIKVLLVHNKYQISGGEDKVVEEEIRLLQKNSIVVTNYFTTNEKINVNGLLNKFKTGINTIWSKKEYENIKRKIVKDKPDVIHFHNTFPLLSPSVYYASHELGIPVVQTLHNYRIACPGAMFLRDGEICEKCISGSLINSIKYGCYRDSPLQTMPLSAMLYTHRFLDTWNKKVDKFIALTNFAKTKFEEIGISSEKIAVKPNFIQKSHFVNPSSKENHVVFVGRISKEKGLHLLLEAWKKIGSQIDAKLDIIGDGPLREEYESKFSNIDNIKFHGKLDGENVLKYMSKAKYIVVPSVWYEGFPMTIVEAFSVNTPVITSNIGSLKEVVNDGITGFYFVNNNVNSLVEVLIRALLYPNYSTLQQNVKNQFDTKYTSEANIKMLINIYKEVIRKGK